MNSGLDTFQLPIGQASQTALSATLFFMMLAVALGLRVGDFAFIKTAPRLFITGFLAQWLALPLATLGLCYVLQPHPAIALGMLLIACCPGGNVSNILVLLARGNVALSVSLTAASSVMAAFYTPIAIVFWTSLYDPTATLLNQINIDVVNFLLQTAAVLALPLLIGMVIARVFPEFSRRIRKPMVALSSLALVLMILGTLWSAGEVLISVGGLIIGIVALHNACAYLLGYGIARLAGLGVRSRRTITFEMGIQNSGLGIVIIMAQLGGVGAAAAIAGLWGVWHILAGLTVLGLFRFADKINHKVESQA